MSVFKLSTVSSIALALTVVLSGCGTQGDRPDLGYVTGKVTIDGAPLSGVIVAFLPDNGRAALGLTNAEGEYELEYLDGKGCKVGPNTMGLSVPTGGSPSHAIPKKYQDKSDVKVDVQPGANTFDFDLTSDAPSKTPAKKVPTIVD
ncbi:MAG: hypothetical protein V4719_02725 [Planctomycetota bacterium]